MLFLLIDLVTLLQQLLQSFLRLRVEMNCVKRLLELRSDVSFPKTPCRFPANKSSHLCRKCLMRYCDVSGIPEGPIASGLILMRADLIRQCAQNRSHTLPKIRI